MVITCAIPHSTAITAFGSQPCITYFHVKIAKVSENNTLKETLENLLLMLLFLHHRQFTKLEKPTFSCECAQNR